MIAATAFAIVGGAFVLYILALLGLAGRVSCWVGHHDWYSPAGEHGKDIPEEWRPQPGDGSTEVIAKFRDYTTMRCTRCPKRYSL